MKIGVAQTRPVKGNISANIKLHQDLINLSINSGADAIFFPELSLTGYEPELAERLATDPNDSRFDTFQYISNKNKITICLGLPIRSTNGIFIGMLIFQPHQQRQTYSKQQLHSDEFPFFIPGDKQSIITVENVKIAPAICYESLQDNHAENAKQLGADIYIASVAKSQKGLEKALVHFPAVAVKYSMPVMMSNCIGFCDNFESIGNSAVWSQSGKLLISMDNGNEGILLLDSDTGEVSNITNWKIGAY